MTVLMAILVLAFIVSIDGFIAGSTLGLRRVKVPIISLSLVGLTSALIMYASISLGDAIREATSYEAVERVGAFLLVILGVLLLLKLHREQTERSVANDKEVSAAFTATAVVDVWHNPLLADQDNSGEISVSEALVLGLALALDSLGAGFGAGMAGLDPLTSSICSGIGTIVLVIIGIRFGAKLAKIFSEKILSMLPGLMLILLGCWRMVW